MEKDKSPNQHHHGGGLPPHSSSNRYSSFPSSSNNFGTKSEASSSSLPPPSPATSQELGHFSHDISGMSDLPRKNLGHRRAHSEIISLPDDISFDSDLGVVGSADGPSFSDDTEEDLFSMYIDMDKFSTSSATSGEPSGSMAQTGINPPNENLVIGSSERPRIRHQHSLSMDGSTSIKPELLMSGSEGGSLAETKKAISDAKLADLALIDPKRAKRIWANRQSAARSKERKMRYISELERKVQTLQTEATTLSAQLTMLQRDTTGLTAENSELKLRLQTMEQQVHLQDALNDALREEVQRLKMVTGQAIANGGGPMMNFGGSLSSFGGANNQQFYNNNHAMHTLLAAHQFQQLQIHSQQQQQQQPHQIQLQQHLQQQQSGGELKMKGGGGGGSGSVPSSSQRDGGGGGSSSSDMNNPPSSKD
ncbi:Basic-leucine zipper domain [Macleaya cordata]|uniref:Basic-leucine zipper domain n=1 Tax=Macleaya cordata TaxID=56857 RepID=A0A200QED7_MACCD|nr:Basic-leucine zipper domain [Macleaya cordata]